MCMCVHVCALGKLIKGNKELVKNTLGSCKGPGFDCQHLHGNANSRGSLCRLLDSMGTICTWCTNILVDKIHHLHNLKTDLKNSHSLAICHIYVSA